MSRQGGAGQESSADPLRRTKPDDCQQQARQHGAAAAYAWLVDQVKLTKEASPGTSVWVYRNSVKALPVRFYVDFVFLGVT
jgi:hypothetical protein